jgi:hypothetical protein
MDVTSKRRRPKRRPANKTRFLVHCSGRSERINREMVERGRSGVSGVGGSLAIVILWADGRAMKQRGSRQAAEALA